MYYVYEWYIVETGEIIYVGKGTKNRYKVRKHNKLFNEMIKRFVCESRIVKEFEKEQDAFDYEFVRVNELRSQGQCVCNIHRGGFGGTDSWWTDELRKQYSENNVMKSEIQRKRMSENNPMKDKDIAEKTNSQKRKAVIIGDKEYRSIKEACEVLGVYWETINSWCRKGINPNGEMCRFKGYPQIEFSDKRYNKGGSKAVIFNNSRYECIKDFANSNNISINTARAWLRRGFNTEGIPCRYENDNRELVFVNRHVARNKAKSKPVIINDIEYKSCEHASVSLNIPKSTLYSYLNGSKHNKKYICRYGNQQPSHGNTDNSTVEGSTTNG